MELIGDDEDRLLITSLGHWTGDATWFPGPQPPFNATAQMALPIGAPPKKMRLSYPNIKVKPGYPHYLYFNFINFVMDEDKTCTVRISDGIQTIERIETVLYEQYWIWVVEAMDIPLNWIKTGTYLEIEASGTPTMSSLLEFTNFTFNAFPPPGKVQYLPIMGIG